MVCTAAPCEACAKAIYHAGIISLYVPEDSYSTGAGLDFLESYGVEVSCITNGDT
jgi:deoxycytidylate deaminase